MTSQGTANTLPYLSVICTDMYNTYNEIVNIIANGNAISSTNWTCGIKLDGSSSGRSSYGNYGGAIYFYTASGSGTSTNLASMYAGTVAGSFAIGMDVFGPLYAYSFNTFSDISLKSNIQTLTNSLEVINNLRGCSYTYSSNNISSIGVIAQEVKEILPEIVQESSDGYLSVSYGAMSGVFIEAIKELNSNVISLQNQVNYLQNILISSNIISSL